MVAGSRSVLTAIIATAVFLVVFALANAGVVAIGPGSNVATVFGSGFISGVLTLTTVALSINQLILSRVFGSPDEFLQELQGAGEIRGRIRSLSDGDRVPNDPAAFLSTVASTMRDRSGDLRVAIDASDWDPPPDVDDYVDDVASYAASLESEISREVPMTEVLLVVLGPGYADRLVATERVRSEYSGRLSRSADRQIDAIYDLLEVLAVARQFFKTISLQQDFAQLSRAVAYTGFVAVVGSVVLTLVYRTGGVAIDAAYLPLVVSAGVTVAVLPLAVFVSYVLRAATIARYTVSVGPFVPPRHFHEK